jgi:hypothetical protein
MKNIQRTTSIRREDFLENLGFPQKYRRSTEERVPKTILAHFNSPDLVYRATINVLRSGMGLIFSPS